MFDKLVESSKQKKRGRTGRYFLITSLIYAVALTAFGVLTILWFNPSMAVAYECLTPLALPIQMPNQPSAPAPLTTRGAASGATAPRQYSTEVPDEIVVGKTITNLPPRVAPPGHYLVANLPPGDGTGIGSNWPGVLGGTGNDPLPPPPARPTPSPKPEPIPSPTPAQPTKVSEGVMMGSAINKVYPVYPAPARQLRLSDVVQVQITISEEGRVIDAVVLKGHPFFREAALQAVRKWTFNPTKLSRVPIRVHGIITFNFTFNQ
jgi:TonB family protein